VESQCETTKEKAESQCETTQENVESQSVVKVELLRLSMICLCCILLKDLLEDLLKVSGAQGKMILTQIPKQEIVVDYMQLLCVGVFIKLSPKM
jgi:hypothetical protein